MGMCTCYVSSVMSNSATLRPVACQSPLFMGFSRQEYQSGLPCPPPRGPPGPGIKPMSPVSPALAGRFFSVAPPGKPIYSKCPPEILFMVIYSREMKTYVHSKTCRHIVTKCKFLCPTHSEVKQTEMSEFGSEKGLLQGVEKG